MAIDCHAHVFARGLTLAGQRRYTPGYDATAEAYLAMLDANGVARGVLIQPSFLGTDNSFMCQTLRTQPLRLRGIAVVEPGLSGDGLAALGRDGVVGIRLNLIGRPDPALAEAAWQAHLARVAALGWQVELHAEAHRLPALLPPLLACGAPVVVDHFGRPDPRLGIADPGFRFLLAAGRTGRLWVKLSGAYRNGPNGQETAVTAAALLRDVLGLDHLLWGSDWPHTQFEDRVTPQAALRALESWLPDPADRRVVLEDAPIRLFGFTD